jgi:hypothetical protein
MGKLFTLFVVPAIYLFMGAEHKQVYGPLAAAKIGSESI